jgi:hypothetical protein
VETGAASSTVVEATRSAAQIDLYRRDAVHPGSAAVAVAADKNEARTAVCLQAAAPAWDIKARAGWE